MERRITELDKAIVRIEAVLPTLATKEELHRGFSDVTRGQADLVKWIVGTVFAGIALVLAVGTFVLNNVTKAPSAPTVVVVPPIAASPAPAQTPPQQAK